jgi:homoserine dehydrogenase
MALAKEHGVTYLLEASVGGGIPIIHPMKYCLWANDVVGISGILNGTTNFMLTMMNEQGVSFDEALKTAQKLGYAEQDPTADVDGFDAARKIAILSSIMTGSHIALSDVSIIEGIRGVDSADVANAAKAGYAVKLLGRSVKTENGFAVYVAPHLVPISSALSAVSDVFNAICVTGNMLGDAMFYGKGAGSLPTASAVVSDIVEVVRLAETEPVWGKRREGVTADAAELSLDFYVRASGAGAELYKKTVELFGEPGVISDEKDTELAFIAKGLTKAQLDEKLSALAITPASVIRVLK